MLKPSGREEQRESKKEREFFKSIMKTKGSKSKKSKPSRTALRMSKKALIHVIKVSTADFRKRVVQGVKKPGEVAFFNDQRRLEGQDITAWTVFANQEASDFKVF